MNSQPTLSYLVCSTPRSGSTLLCELLTSTGVAGRPEEYFEARPETGLPPHPGDYLSGLPRTGAGIRDDHTPPEAPPYSDLRDLDDYGGHLDRSFGLGTTANGAFGAKVMWRHLESIEKLVRTLPEYETLAGAELLSRALGDPTYIWMRRSDKVRQAISLWRALQTRTWRLERPSSDHSPPELRYSFEGIDHLTRALTADDESWGRFLGRNRLHPLIISYEGDLEPDPEGTIRRVLQHIGVDAPAGWHPAPQMIRQSDGVNDEWHAAYHRDVATCL